MESHPDNYFFLTGRGSPAETTTIKSKYNTLPEIASPIASGISSAAQKNAPKDNNSQHRACPHLMINFSNFDLGRVVSASFGHLKA